MGGHMFLARAWPGLMAVPATERVHWAARRCRKYHCEQRGTAPLRMTEQRSSTTRAQKRDCRVPDKCALSPMAQQPDSPSPASQWIACCTGRIARNLALFPFLLRRSHGTRYVVIPH